MFSVADHDLAQRRRRTVAALLVTALATVLLTATAGPALAHSSLRSTDPADGSTVTTAPDRVTLVFDQPAQELGTEVVVLGPDGATVSTGPVVLDGTSVAQELAADRPAGVYTVRWRVTSADGHPVEGTTTFTAEQAAGGAAAGADDQPAAASTVQEPDPIRETLESYPDETIVAELTESGDAGPPAGAIIVVAVIVLAAGAVLVLIERRRIRAGRSEP